MESHYFIRVDDNITHQNEITFDQFATGIKNMWFGTKAERESVNSANLLAAKRLAFHYALFAHQMDGNPAGRGDMPGMDFVVSLGQVDSAPDPKSQHPVGTRSMQASTFMHELGHNLNLNHGGNEETNCKTNYISVMNDMTVVDIR